MEICHNSSIIDHMEPLQFLFPGIREWLAIFAPFLALAVGVNEKRRSLLYCEWGIGLTYCALSNVIYAKNVDNYMVNYGILPMLTGHTYAGISFGEWQWEIL